MRGVLLCALLVGASGCASLVVDPFEKLRADNKRAIAGLALGMPRHEVEARLPRQKVGGGLFDVVHGRFQHQTAQNPVREERLRAADGLDYEVVYYYTELNRRDEKITDDELTPLYFRDGRLARIGR